MEYLLSSDSDALICVLYAEYLNRRSHKIPIEKAAYFHDDFSIQKTFLPEWLPEDVTTVCGWLVEKDLLAALACDDHFTDVFLTETAVIYMESRFARKRESVISHLKELVSFGVSIAGLTLK